MKAASKWRSGYKSNEFVTSKFLARQPLPNGTFSLFPNNVFATDGDVVVLVGSRKFHEDKKVLFLMETATNPLVQYLAMHAPFFNILFNGAFNEAGKREVTLDDVEPEDFLTFLRAVYPSASNTVVRGFEPKCNL